MTRLPTRAALLTSTAMTRLPTLAFNTSVRWTTGVDENCAIDRATWNSMIASANLPTGKLDENRAIDCIAVLIPKLCHKLEAEYSREWLETALQKGLREGRLNLIRYAVQAATDKGDEIADAALRYVYVQITRKEIPEQPGHLYVRLYGEDAVLQPHKRRPGRPWHNTWLRDIQLCMLIDFVRREFGVRPTRQREVRPTRHRDAQRIKRAPSAISLVVATLERNGHYYNEANIQEHIWPGLAGELVRADRTRASESDFACG